jgi:hypothetical protein
MPEEAQKRQFAYILLGKPPFHNKDENEHQPDKAGRNMQAMRTHQGKE